MYGGGEREAQREGYGEKHRDTQEIVRFSQIKTKKKKKRNTQTDAEQLLPFSNIIHSGITLALLVGIPQNSFSTKLKIISAFYLCRCSALELTMLSVKTARIAEYKSWPWF